MMTSKSQRREWIRGTPLLVSRERASAFAAAVGETHPDFLDGSTTAPTFAITLVWDVQNLVMADALPEGLGLHGEQAFRFHAPIETGMHVHSRARLESIVPRGSGTTVTARTETYEGDRLLCSQLFTVFVVGQTLPVSGEPADLAADLPAPGAHLHTAPARSEVLPVNQPAQYSEASGDTYGIHVDAAYARSMGLPGTIAHGMSTMAYAARGVREGIGTPARLTYLAARFSSAVTPGATLTTRVRATSPDDGQVDGVFETVVDEIAVVTNGRFAADIPQ